MNLYAFKKLNFPFSAIADQGLKFQFKEINEDIFLKYLGNDEALFNEGVASHLKCEIYCLYDSYASHSTLNGGCVSSGNLDFLNEVKGIFHRFDGFELNKEIFLSPNAIIPAWVINKIKFKKLSKKILKSGRLIIESLGVDACIPLPKWNAIYGNVAPEYAVRWYSLLPQDRCTVILMNCLHPSFNVVTKIFVDGKTSDFLEFKEGTPKGDRVSIKEIDDGFLISIPCMF